MFTIIVLNDAHTLTLASNLFCLKYMYVSYRGQFLQEFVGSRRIVELKFVKSSECSQHWLTMMMGLWNLGCNWLLTSTKDISPGKRVFKRCLCLCVSVDSSYASVIRPRVEPYVEISVSVSVHLCSASVKTGIPLCAHCASTFNKRLKTALL